ncbi:Predicted dehydrogenase [Mariniphaga anaerophila]|uniref:Predicted dehydrogenase n=1 Tax=Mariniphaga anaerophila TaxID=1484053 RepID=A0A1M5DCQ7_9BACT|nr:Gfo/Idh/MocA family oxidoreductase [Mariniphaga anaerophila]SHF64789.1 Predicted dehydrogenase [Mariniphaga anaerophila]
MKTWNIGIIGTGMIADFHAKSIQSLPNARLAGFSNIRSGKAKKMAEKYSVKYWDTYQSMLKSDEVDMVMIATPSGAHMEPVIEAAKCGKHVLCEKPLEIETARIDRMIEAHQKAGTRLGGIFNLRYNETTRIMKKAIDDKRLGTITYAAVHVPWWRNNAYYEGWHGTWSLDGGGALMNQAIHMIDLLQYLMGPVSKLGAFTSNIGHPQIEAEDTAVSVLQFENKALGVIYGTTASYPGQFRRLEITGTKGSIVLVENSLQVWQFAEMTEDDEKIIQQYGKIEGGGGVADPAAISFENHAKNLAAFIQSVEENRPFEIDGEEAKKSVALILDIYKSAQTNSMINKNQA